MRTGTIVIARIIAVDGVGQKEFCNKEENALLPFPLVPQRSLSPIAQEKEDRGGCLSRFSPR